MGAAGSRALASAMSDGSEAVAPGSRSWGLENFGNTCYANSVLQALYACTAFRERTLLYHSERERGATKDAAGEEHLLACLAELFASIASQRKRTGVLSPKRFVARLKRDNELFRSFQHQDAHEFLNFLLNSCCDILEKEERAKLPAPAPGAPPPPPPRTWVHELFQGTLTNQTRCMWCEAVSNREETYLDLSLDIARNSSVGSCLAGFSAVELLAGADKFRCDTCAGLQEAQKRLLIRAAPPVLALHLKRFKFAESLGVLTKLAHRVAFPTQLRLDGTCVEAGSPALDAAYALFAVVVHVGSGPNHGHYVTVVKQQPPPPPPPPAPALAAASSILAGSGISAAAAAAAAAAAPAVLGAAAATWIKFDDDSVETVDESILAKLFGSEPPSAAGADGGGEGEGGSGGAESGGGGAQPPPPEVGVAPPGTLPPPPATPEQQRSSNEHGYILFYERVTPERPAGGLR